MPWFKLYASILDDDKMHSLSPHNIGIWVRVCAMCARTGNKVPLDRAYLAPRLRPHGFKKAVSIDFMWDLGLIEKWSASTDKRRGEEIRGEEILAKKKSPNYVNQNEPRKSGWVNPAQERLRNNLEVARRVIERHKNESDK